MYTFEQLYYTYFNLRRRHQKYPWKNYYRRGRLPYDFYQLFNDDDDERRTFIEYTYMNEPIMRFYDKESENSSYYNEIYLPTTKETTIPNKNIGKYALQYRIYQHLPWGPYRVEVKSIETAGITKGVSRKFSKPEFVYPLPIEYYIKDIPDRHSRKYQIKMKTKSISPAEFEELYKEELIRKRKYLGVARHFTHELNHGEWSIYILSKNRGHHFVHNCPENKKERAAARGVMQGRKRCPFCKIEVPDSYRMLASVQKIKT